VIFAILNPSQTGMARQLAAAVRAAIDWSNVDTGDVNHAAMSEMQICLDPPVSNAPLVGVMAQDLDDHATASLPGLRLAWVGRGIDTKIRRRPSPVLPTGDRLWDSPCGFEKSVGKRAGSL
jgi:hypothetical protein